VETGYSFPPYYDSLMAKLIVRAHDRKAAVASALAAAQNTTIAGLKTTLPMLEYVLSHEDFIAGEVPTSWFGPIWEERKATDNV
jgi:acetyl-CoA carboxylase biotin carboxylase subunit